MRLDYLTIFPDYFDALQLSLVGKAIASGLIDVGVHDLRQWTRDPHRTVDDTPFGGGAGMVMKPEPWGEAIDALLAEPDPTSVFVVPSPSGFPLQQGLVQELATYRRLVFACGRYEGIDARVMDYAATKLRVLPLSLGDYVLNGGEVAALAITEAVVRLLPGVIGNPQSLSEESFSDGTSGLLEYPMFTKPASWRGLDVPAVLLSGHHGRVEQWRREQSVALTKARRPDLIAQEQY
ncbi:MAG: tRNA (guanosine(37)-N1)-methyltransferase TrmD [Propionibacteriaceae bacterium]|jgi:tRNA (guanine37-N1)-methyltransferase|nr:tRNA (guanosine(37)-N1)-methyltransferase TrmD [Propionibacteriaceae bacterium]